MQRLEHKEERSCKTTHCFFSFLSMYVFNVQKNSLNNLLIRHFPLPYFFSIAGLPIVQEANLSFRLTFIVVEPNYWISFVTKPKSNVTNPFDLVNIYRFLLHNRRQNLRSQIFMLHLL